MSLLVKKGGGPYGSEVTRGQDLSGKDFSGKTLIKQDFKTVQIDKIQLKHAHTFLSFKCLLFNAFIDFEFLC